jgi:AcrR family transcriptional regulator
VEAINLSDDNIKEKILQAVIDLMKDDTENITVRKIAAHAGVTQGLINYHFQTKDNLINIAAQRFVDETVSHVPDRLEQIGGEPIDLLRKSMKLTFNYLVEHPNVSRISILRDMQAGHIKDNMQSSIDAYDKLLQHILMDKKQRFLAGHIFSASMQSLFMRADTILEMQGMDISDSAVRNQFIDDLVDIVMGGLSSWEKN